MDELVEKVADAVGELRLDVERWEGEMIARAIIPMIYEDAAKVLAGMADDENGRGTDEGFCNADALNDAAKAIRERSLSIVGE